MKPVLAADELLRSLTQYLTTTFALVEKPVRHALTENGNPLPQLLVHGSSWSVTLRRAE